MSRRLGQLCILHATHLFLVTLVAFAIPRALPADPVLIALAQRNQAATPEAIAQLERHFGLDRPLPLQYAHWLGRFLVGDWGTSFRTDRPVRVEILSRAPQSLMIGGGGLAVAAALALPLGFAAARRPGGAADAASRLIAVATQAVPVFWLALGLLWLLGVYLELFIPLAGGWTEQHLLPIALIGLYSCGSLARVVRAEFLHAVDMPWMRTAHAKGLRAGAALWRHGRRAVAFALTAALIPEAAWVVGGTAVTEVVFAVPGLSQFLVDSVAARDYAVLQAYVVMIAVWMSSVHVSAGGLSAWLEPRLARRD